jgi:hypothetical protein
MIDREGNSDKIGRDDLFLLMESYKNTIELNTTLLERQEIISRHQTDLLESIAEVCGNQNTILAELKTIPGAVRNAVADVAHLVRETNDIHKSEFRTLREQGAAFRKEDIKEHASFNNRLYVAMSGMAAIIVSLIAIIIKLV